MHRTALLLSLCLASGGLISGCALAYDEDDDFWITDLAVPKPEVRGVAVVGSQVQAVEVATAAAVFNQPDAWAVNLTGRVLGGEEFGEALVVLDTVDDVFVVSPSEVAFTVDYNPDQILGAFDIAEVCVQMVHITSGGDKYLGAPDCLQESP